jgi:uncharacterized protein YycO
MLIELFSKSNAIGSKIIRAVEWGEWSHCAYLHPQKMLVVEAVWPEGVRVIPFSEWLEVGHKTAWAKKTRNDLTHAVWERAASQKGKPYDSTGVLGLGFHRDWQEDDSWWCSELNEWAAQTEGFGVYDPEQMHRIGVKDRWRLK